MTRLLPLGCMLFLLTSLHGQNWPSFRGPGATGLADGQNPPVSWDPDQSTNILWEVPIPGLSHSSPIVWGDRIFVLTVISSEGNPEFRRAYALEGSAAGESSSDMSKQSWRLYSLDKRSGKVVWQRTVYEATPKVKRHPKNSHASQTPATNGKYVIVSLGPEGLYCFDYQGNLRWRQDLSDWDFLNTRRGGGAITTWGVASSPIIYKNLAIVQCDSHNSSFIAAFDIETGRKVWLTPRQATSSWSTPTVYEGKTRAELITNGTDHVWAYDPMTGKELWRLKGTTNISTPTPFASGDLLYLDSGFHSKGPIFVIRPGGDGDITPPKGERSGKYVAWSVETGASENPTPIVYGDYLYVVSNNGILTCYKAKTGEIVYKQRIGLGGAYSASPVAADGRIYLTSEDGDVHVLKAGPGFELLATNPMGEVCMATPAISGGMIIIRTQHRLFGVGAK